MAFFVLNSIPLALYFRLRWEGVEHVPRDGPAVIAANHVSMVDGPAAAGPPGRRASRRRCRGAPR